MLAWRYRPPSEEAREAVRLHCAQAWGEYPAVFHLGRHTVRYEVPGRRLGGTARGRHRLRWLASRLGRGARLGVAAVLLAPVLLPTLVVLELLDARGRLDPDAWAFGRPELIVAGAPDTHATALGDAAREAGAELWLAWSGRHLGVMTQRLVWQVDAAGHELSPQLGVIHFGDGSSVTFEPAGAELDRFRERDGWP